MDETELDEIMDAYVDVLNGMPTEMSYSDRLRETMKLRKWLGDLYMKGYAKGFEEGVSSSINEE